MKGKNRDLYEQAGSSTGWLNLLLLAVVHRVRRHFSPIVFRGESCSWQPLHSTVTIAFAFLGRRRIVNSLILRSSWKKRVLHVKPSFKMNFMGVSTSCISLTLQSLKREEQESKSTTFRYAHNDETPTFAGFRRCQSLNTYPPHIQ